MSPAREPARGALPLRSIDTLILTMLVRGARHGYGIMLDVAEHTGGAVQLEAGSLYRSIRRLVDEGLVAEAAAPADADRDHERRRYYALTTHGRRTLAAEVLRLRRLVQAAEAAGLVAPARSPAGA